MSIGLTAKNISVILNDAQILRDTSLTVARGELVGLVGPNGAGKSTLLRALLGLVPVEAGAFALDGNDLSELPQIARAREIAYAPQGAPLHWPLTVEALVGLGRIPHLGPLRKPGVEDQKAISTALRRTDCIELVGRNAMSLSGGERARVMLARALAVGAPYLLADEPVASLDPYHQLQVMDILKSLAGANHGVVVVLHDLSLAARYCDRLILMRDGGVHAEGPADTVLSDANLADVYRIAARRNGSDEPSLLVPWDRIDPQ